LGSTPGTPGSGGALGRGGSPSSAAGTGAVQGPNGTATGGMISSSGGMTNGNGDNAQKPCVDTQPPPDPNWPNATCANWANETEECKAPWFASYCDVSCGRCVPQGGGGGGSSNGAAGSSNGAGGPSSGAGGSASGTGGRPNGTGGSSNGAAGSSTNGPATAVDCSTKGLPSVSGGSGFATRYWDCCQPHCAQFDGHRCEQNGTTRTGNTQSSCAGGGAYACYDEAPKAVNDCLSYGYIAKTNPNCGQCYRIQFTGEGQHNAADPGSQLLKGKQMIVKVSNTGGDVANNQFDLMIPGGGVGQFNACSKQWSASELGAQYGGFLTNCSGTHSAKKECVRQNCSKIPAGPARDGCLWFVDWFQVADNPKFTSQQTDCPF
jgi:hypothetical protein